MNTNFNQVLKRLCKETNTKNKDWKHLDFIESGVGEEYLLRNNKKKLECYICIDQGELHSYNILEAD